MITGNGLIQIGIYFVVLLLLVKPLGLYMANVYNGRFSFLSPAERFLYRLAGIKHGVEMNWKKYLFAVLMFSFGNFILLYCILRWQSAFPLNPENMADLTPDLAFNTAVSFTTNTNWQSYGGESILSYFSQIVGLTMQNFASAAVGIAVLIAFIRGLCRKNTKELGNFWVDLLRGNLYILLPLSLLWTLLLGSQGVVQTFSNYQKVPLIESQQIGKRSNDQGHYLRIYMQHLRQKLGDNALNPKYIITETGIGYRLKEN